MHRPLTIGHAVLATALLGLAACGRESTTASTAVPPDTVVLKYLLWGGCNMAGPNCPIYTVHADGTVEVGRNSIGPSGDPDTTHPVEATGRVPAADLATFLDLAEDADPDALLAELGPGSCASCVDGADITVIVHPGTADEVRLDSTVVEFDPAHPLFAALEALAGDFAEAAPLPVVWPEQTVTS